MCRGQKQRRFRRWVKISVLVGIWFLPVDRVLASPDSSPQQDGTGMSDEAAAGTLLGLGCRTITGGSTAWNPVKFFYGD